MKHIIWAFLASTIWIGQLTAQNDSIIQRINSRPDDLEKIEDYNHLFSQLVYHYPDSALVVAEQQRALSIKLDSKNGLGRALNQIGLVYDLGGEFAQANEYYNHALKVFVDSKDSAGIGQSYLNLGIINYLVSDYEEANKYYHEAMAIGEAILDTNLISNTCNNVGLIMKDLGKNRAALKYFYRSLDIDLARDNKEGAGTSYNNIGIAYKLLFKYDSALIFFDKALLIRTELDDQDGVAKAKGNIGRVYDATEDLTKAILYMREALEIEIKIGDKNGEAGSYLNLGEVYIKRKEYNTAEMYLLKGLLMAENISRIEFQAAACNSLAILYKATGAYKKSIEYSEKTTALKDSIMSSDAAARILEIEGKYDFERKNKEIEILKTETALSQAEIEKNKATREREIVAEKAKNQRRSFVLYSVIAISFIMLVAGVFLVRQNRIRKATNLVLAEQKEMLNERNKDITDSITYAQRIQNAILKQDSQLSQHLPPHFILFKPKDIVSGDFYWSYKTDDAVFIAAADCTGHGVPGAFMSLLGITFLNDILVRNPKYSPAQILESLRERIIKELDQKEGIGGSRDGMDISMIKLNKDLSEAEWAGANNPLWIVAKTPAFKENAELGYKLVEHNEVCISEIRPDKQAISYFSTMLPFTNHKIDLRKGDLIVLFSDGYADQFGGARGKKLKYTPFKKLIAENYSKTLDYQKEQLDTLFEEWRGDFVQIDDVCVLGIEV